MWLIDMKTIKFDKRNYRIHSDENKELIKKSLLECGAGRSILNSESTTQCVNGGASPTRTLH